jgi:SPP1 gp7 family putative phage head morphogenesis protein
MARPSADPNAFQEAVDWFRQRVPMTDQAFAALEGNAHERAFKVAGAAQLDLVHHVWEALDDALAKGTTLKDFAKTVEDRLTSAWGGEDPFRVETVFRTNLQHAYSRGRWEQQTDPAVKDLRPYWEYSAILDLGTTEVCRKAHGTVLTADDAFWQTHNPPCHFRCRSTIISLTPEQARARGITPSPTGAAAAKGFGQAPGADDWHPELEKYPQPLAAEAAVKLAPRPAPAPAPPRSPVVPTPPPKVPQAQPVPPPAPAPWRKAATVEEAKAQIEGYGLKVAPSAKGTKQARPDLKAPEADRVAHLNRVGEEVDRIRERFPYWYEKLKGVAISEQPAIGTSGVFMYLDREVIVPRDMTEIRWRDTVARCRAGGREPALVQDEAEGWSRMTIRHELAHALDRNDAPKTFGDDWRFSGKDSLFNAIWKESARTAGKPIAAFVRGRVSEYALKSLQERFAESVMMYSSPRYVPGSLPSGVERHLGELLEKGPPP